MGFCESLTSSVGVHLFAPYKIGIAMVVLGSLYIVMGVGIIVYLKVQEYLLKQKDDDSVGQTVIFPIYVIIIICNCIVCVYVGFIAWTFAFSPFNINDKADAWAFAIMWGALPFVISCC
jgi:hypothetical protein